VVAYLFPLVLFSAPVPFDDNAISHETTQDQLIDVIEGNRAYIPALYVFNKIDAITIEELDILDQLPNYVPISSFHKWNIEGKVAAIDIFIQRRSGVLTHLAYGINLCCSLFFRSKNSWKVRPPDISFLRSLLCWLLTIQPCLFCSDL